LAGVTAAVVAAFVVDVVDDVVGALVTGVAAVGIEDICPLTQRYLVGSKQVFLQDFWFRPQMTLAPEYKSVVQVFVLGL